MHKFIRISEKKAKISEKALISDLILDPLWILLHGAFSDLNSREELLKKERWRQLDKGFSNRIGAFHETILASVTGWHKPEGGFDLRNDQKKIIVEIKNKHNTMNSASAEKTYENCLQFYRSNRDWKVYLAHIIPRSGRTDKPWKISAREENENIRLIDGATLYEIVTEDKDALMKIYDRLPRLLKKSQLSLSPEVEQWFTQHYKNVYHCENTPKK